MSSYQGEGINFPKLLPKATITEMGLLICSLSIQNGGYQYMTDFSFVRVEWELDDNDAPEPSLEPILSGGQVPG